VSCVAHLTNDWKTENLITDNEKDVIKSCAGQAYDKDNDKVLDNVVNCPDNDGDGFAECDVTCQQKVITSCGSSSLQPCGDCNDSDAAVYPDATELCDDIDNDCNDIIDTDNESC
jgi:hypothetical protein